MPFKATIHAGRKPRLEQDEMQPNDSNDLSDLYLHTVESNLQDMTGHDWESEGFSCFLVLFGNLGTMWDLCIKRYRLVLAIGLYWREHVPFTPKSKELAKVKYRDAQVK